MQSTACTFSSLLMIAGLAVGNTAASVVEPPLRSIQGLKVYTGPDTPAIDNGVILIRGAQIVGVEQQAGAAAPLVPACNGGVIVAGFQNSHVHLTGKAFASAKNAPAAVLADGLTQLLTRYGFTTAFDIASDRANTLALRTRIERGELRGPRILTAGLPLFPAKGLPVYLDHFDPAFRDLLPQPADAAAAVTVVRENLDAGADATKLFLVTPQPQQTVKRMPFDIAQAAADETHRRGKLVFAHPTDLAGVRMALDAKVDILAHPPLGTPGPWPEALMGQLREAGVAMIPTLKLLRYELAKEQVPQPIADRILEDSVREFGKFAAAGGQVLFGTDVDYMTDLDPTDEYALMAQAGMSAMQILASLTTTPAWRWNEAQHRGRLAAGMDADIVVLNGDPAVSAKHFADVKCAIRGGLVIFAR